jgi:hypothetical protein
MVLASHSAGRNEAEQDQQHHDSLEPPGGTDSFLHGLNLLGERVDICRQKAAELLGEQNPWD